MVKKINEKKNTKKKREKKKKKSEKNKKFYDARLGEKNIFGIEKTFLSPFFVKTIFLRSSIY